MISKPQIINRIKKLAGRTALYYFALNGAIRQFFEDFGVSKDEYGESYFISLASLSLAFLFSVVKTTLRPTLWLNLKTHFKSNSADYKHGISIVVGVISVVPMVIVTAFAYSYALGSGVSFVEALPWAVGFVLGVGGVILAVVLFVVALKLGRVSFAVSSVSIMFGVIATLKVYSFGSGGETSIVEAFIWSIFAMLAFAFIGVAQKLDNRW